MTNSITVKIAVVTVHMQSDLIPINLFSIFGKRKLLNAELLHGPCFDEDRNALANEIYFLQVKLNEAGTRLLYVYNVRIQYIRFHYYKSKWKWKS
jgi:hypothetical protein